MQYQDTGVEARVSVPKREVRGPHPASSQWLNTELKPAFQLQSEPCVSVITVLITGSITAYVMRGVNPHYGGFLGDSFTPRTPYK